MTGLEQRGCWQEQVAGGMHIVAIDGGAGRRPRAPAPIEHGSGAVVPARDFVPVELLGQIVIATAPMHATSKPAAPSDEPSLPAPPISAEAEPAWADRTSLFGDPDG